MKNNFFFLAVLAIGIVISIMTISTLKALAFPNPDPVKTYTVVHTQQEWRSEMDTLRMLQGSVGYAMTRQQSDQWQLVLARMQDRYIQQLVPQYRKEAADAKKDSTKPKSKN